MALSYLVPYKIGDTYYTDYRLPIMAWLLAAASLRPDFGQRRAYAAAVGVGLLALVLTRTACVQWIWTQRQVDVQAVREATAPVPPGAKVLPVVHLGPESQGRHAPLGRFPGGNVSFWHYAVLVIPDRQAFAPSLFTAAGKQPVSVRAAYARMDSPNSPVVGIGALRKPYDQIPASIDHVRGWREEFDYILVLNADLPEEGIRDPRVPGLDPVTDTGFAQLFRVRKVSSAS